LWKGLDFLLAEMAKRDMKAVLYLNNFWQWSGGMSQYVAWFNGKPVVDPDVTGDWNAFMDNSAAFYREPKAQEAWRGTIKLLIGRKNSVNGRRYDNDPTIMSWQLANEPRPGSDAHSKPHYDVFVKWTDETAGYIKKLAPKQLVSTGNEGWMGTGGSKELFEKSHQTRNVDYLTFHMWAPNWQWFDPKNAERTYDGAMVKIHQYLDWHAEAATKMGKPIVLEEFGINRDNGSFSPEAATAYRDRIYAEVYEFIERQAATGSALAGSNFWAWGGEGRTTNADFMWKAGDGFVGDPPQEPQGLYCVFDSDASTIAVIKRHAGRMTGIAPKPKVLVAPGSKDPGAK
jgi:mannan endo-1,4-beta-mannosidase